MKALNKMHVVLKGVETQFHHVRARFDRGRDVAFGLIDGFDEDGNAELSHDDFNRNIQTAAFALQSLLRRLARLPQRQPQLAGVASPPASSRA